MVLSNYFCSYGEPNFDKTKEELHDRRRVSYGHTMMTITHHAPACHNVGWTTQNLDPLL